MHTFVVIVGAKVSVFVATSDVRMLRANYVRTIVVVLVDNGDIVCDLYSQN